MGKIYWKENRMEVKVAPSILSADFSCLGEEIKKIEKAGADLIHIDVMDGCFVPNITIGPCVIKDIRRLTNLLLDVHLMINHPERYLDAFIEAGSDIITMHVETINPMKFKAASKKLKSLGIKVGISLNPRTSLSKIKDVLHDVDLVLVMSVEPGFGGQKFMPLVLPKIRQLRKIFKGDISVDGGVDDKNCDVIIKAGANILAAGSYIFEAKDTKKAIERIKHAKY